MDKIRIKKRLIVGFIMLSSIITFFSCSGTRPSLVNRGHDQLSPCPNSPNCVSTLTTDKKHTIPPIPYTGETSEAMKVLITIINDIPRTKIINQTKDYLYIEFTSKMWKFVDDVEFSFDEDTRTIQFRSASRLGKSDLGVNRERMELIREKFNKKIN